MTDTKYNGWTNYETWLVNLWLDNDGAQQSLAETCAEMYPTRAEFDRYDFAQVIREYVDELRDAAGIPTQGMFADLIGAALSAVDWYEIAEHYGDELPDDEAEDNDHDALPDRLEAPQDAGEILERIRQYNHDFAIALDDSRPMVERSAALVRAFDFGNKEGAP